MHTANEDETIVWKRERVSKSGISHTMVEENAKRNTQPKE